MTDLDVRVIDPYTAEAGHDLDRLIATNVLGWEYRERFRGDTTGYFGEVIDEELPAFSTDIGAAWPIFERHLACQVVSNTVEDPRLRPDLTDIDEMGWAREWCCTAWGRPVTAPTAPLAICRAALVSLLAAGYAGFAIVTRLD